jgi:ribosomal protein L20
MALRHVPSPKRSPSTSTQAKKALQSAAGGWGFFSNKEEKYQNAADYYVQAANAYRLEKLSACLLEQPQQFPYRLEC